MSKKRRLGWAIGVGLANALLFSKGFPTVTEEIVAFLVGAIVGFILSLAAEQTSTKSTARMKLVYWPLALRIF